MNQNQLQEGLVRRVGSADVGGRTRGSEERQWLVSRSTGKSGSQNQIVIVNRKPSVGKFRWLGVQKNKNSVGGEQKQVM